MEDKIIGEGITFDDVLLIPQRSDILPDQVDVAARFVADISLAIPIVSAAMDTVTESSMAIALAQEGGIGIMHRNMAIEAQAGEVSRVKRSEAGVIHNPLTLPASELVGTARQIMRENNISGIPITEGRRLLGIITSRDVRMQEDDSKSIGQVMTRKLITARPGIGLQEAKKVLSEHKIEKLLIVDNDFQLMGLITMKDLLRQESKKRACKDGEGRLRVGAAVGVNDFERAEAVIKADADFLAVDTAHGHSKNVLNSIRDLKKRYSRPIIAGNVATAEGTRDLIEAGADAIKVGIGPGSICTTRIIAGVGVPQLTAVYDCSRVARPKGVMIISDGGIRTSGDVVKALAMGADTVMIGNLFAGCAESPGEAILYHGRSYKTYRGMGSLGALNAGSDRYAQTQGRGKLVPEGVEGIVPFKGPLSDVIFQLVGGLKSGMGYVGAKTIPELQSRAKFLRITGAGLRESHPHDVHITKEAPNYSIESGGV